LEKNIEIIEFDPILFFGVNNEKFDLIKMYFPKLKINARGTELKLSGSEVEIERFVSSYQNMVKFYEKFKRLTKSNIERILEEGETTDLWTDEEVLVYGNHGKQIKPITPNQRKMVKLASKNDMIFAIGPAGTGKTYTAVAMAVKALKAKQVKRIILTRPAVEAGESLGFLPGDMKDKLDPYMQPLYDALRDMYPPEKLKDLMEEGTIQIAPLAFMRGRTLDKAFVILDEAQNATESQFRMFLTRMGKSAKFMITGDATQVDLPGKQKSGLRKTLRLLDDVKGVGQIFLDDKDVVRHPLVKEIIKAYEKADEIKKDKSDGSVKRN
jgi:phosphate starvation-inducible protein PhoH and related proteins